MAGDGLIDHYRPRRSALFREEYRSRGAREATCRCEQPEMQHAHLLGWPQNSPTVAPVHWLLAARAHLSVSGNGLCVQALVFPSFLPSFQAEWGAGDRLSFPLAVFDFFLAA